MAENFVNVTEGSGKKLHSWDRTIGANTVHDEFTLPGEYPLASYTVVTGGVSGATSTDHVLQIMAGSSLNVRIRKIRLYQVSAMTAAQEFSVDIVRLTTAGSGGTTLTARPHDTGDAAAGASAQTLPTAKGTVGVTIGNLRIWGIQTVGAGGLAERGPNNEWMQMPNEKPYIIPAGTSNGIALQITTGRAAIVVQVQVEFVETSFL